MGSYWNVPALLAGAVLLVAAMPGLAHAAGAVTTATQQADGVSFRLDGATLKLQVFSDHIIRVLYAPGATLPPTKSLSVIAAPATAKWTLCETSEVFVLATSAIEAHVDRQTAAVSFFDNTGKPYVAEVPGGRHFSPTAVKNLDATQTRQEFVLPPDEAVFGLGQQQAGGWNYRGRTIRLVQSNMNVAIPVLVSSRGYGVFWDNPAITTVDVGSADKEKVLSWESEVGRAIDYYFLAGPEIDTVIGGYRQLTGTAPLLGKWAYGFWQCRERYSSQQELLGVVEQYRQRGIPIDGIIQDWQYWTPAPWGSHEFNLQRYPDPAGMVKQLHDQHVHLLVSVWAKFDVDSEHYKQLEAVNGLFDPVLPYVYPKGKGKWYDPFSADARKLYWKQMSDKLFTLGIDGWWLDATEPELSGKWGEIRDLRTAAGSGAFVANAYPLMTTTAVYQGQRAQTSDKRVFILTRSAFAGQQRNASVIWSGDIAGNWATFRRQLPAGLNFSLTGIPYWNTDIGGFTGGNPTDAKYGELFTRWFQYGAFCPMFRVHGTNQPKEMWRFGKAIDAILVKFDQLRYRLMPYIYSTAWQVTSVHGTMMRPLVMDFRSDSEALGISDQFMFGGALLVNPVLLAGATTRDVYLPAGQEWYDFWTGKRFAGGHHVEAPAPIDSMPLYVKAGSILPMGPVVQYAMEKPDAPLELRVYRGKDARFILYEDAGDTYNYEKGEYSQIPITWNQAAGKLTIGARMGNFPGMVRQREFRIIWVRDGKGTGLAEENTPDTKITYHGDAVEVTAP